MWKHVFAGRLGLDSEQLGHEAGKAALWRRYLAEGALFAALLLSSSWLVRP